MSGRTPKYRRHKPSRQAVVTLNGHDHYLGKWNTAESRREYDRLIAEWLANSRRLPCSSPTAPNGLTVAELTLAHWQWAVAYYHRDARGGQCLKDALRILREPYGHTLASKFGPRALKTCRQRMIELGWSRNYINAQVNRLRRVFRWAAEEEMLPGSIYVDLKAVAGLEQGRTEARETPKVRPVAAEHVEATLPILPPVLPSEAR
jgi:hypothetical protein